MGGLKLREPEYTTIKQLLAKGYDGKKVAEIMGRGTGTVSTVKNTKDYTDYLEKQKGWHVKEPKQPNEQLVLDVPDDKRADIFTAINKVIDAIYSYQLELDEKGALRPVEVKAIEISTQKLEECRMWLKTYL